jgi:hypothetical protein
MVAIDSLCYHYLSRRSEHNSSNLALVRVVSMCLGPSAVAVMNGKLKTQVIINSSVICTNITRQSHTVIKYEKRAQVAP